MHSEENLESYFCQTAAFTECRCVSHFTSSPLPATDREQEAANTYQLSLMP